MKTIIFRTHLPQIMLLIAALSSCNDKTRLKTEDLPVSVKIETVAESNSAGTMNYVGTVEERSSTALSFSTMGMIDKIYVSEGDFVSKGQFLASLDPASARSMLEAAEATLKQAQDGYDRLKSVYDKGSLPEIQMVDIETKLQQAKSSYDIAGKNLKNCSLYAPLPGVVGKKNAEPGEYSIVGNAVLTIMDISSVKIRFSVPENEISGISRDCKSVITVAALGNKEFSGGKTEKNVMANPVSHTYPVHITLSNPARELLPGMVCRVVLTRENKPGGIVIPVRLIRNTTDGKQFVWTEKDGLAKRSFVTLGAIKGNGVEILEGVSAGDHLVTAGYQKISEDDKITGK